MKKRIKTTQYKHGDTTVYRADVQMLTKLGIWLTVCRIEDPVKWYVEARVEEAKAYMEDERYGCRCKQNRHAHDCQVSQ